MKRSLFWGMLLYLALMLVGCAYYNSPDPSVDLACESWVREVDTNPSKWACDADRWFLTGGMNNTEEFDRHAPVGAAISTMMVRVPCDFTNIRVNGNFQVQLFGTDCNNSVYVYGPHETARNVIVNVTNNTLCLSQSKDAPRGMGCVIVRIGIKNLNKLVQSGCGLIEGRGIRSDHLCIISSGNGNIYLAGPVNLAKVVSNGNGSVNVFGAVTPELSIITTTSGSVNVCGKVGIHDITHHGCSNINIIGANTNCLTVSADGQGKIGIFGRVAVNKIDARDHVRVYIYYVNGCAMNVYVTDYARVGLAGRVRTAYVDTQRLSRFQGHYLHANDVFARAHDASHINVNATNKVFADAGQNSSVYYFGSPNTLSQFHSDNGVVIPITTSDGRAVK